MVVEGSEGGGDEGVRVVVEESEGGGDEGMRVVVGGSEGGGTEGRVLMMTQRETRVHGYARFG